MEGRKTRPSRTRCTGIGHMRAVECPWSVGQGQKQRVRRERGDQEIEKQVQTTLWEIWMKWGRETGVK